MDETHGAEKLPVSRTIPRQGGLDFAHELHRLRPRRAILARLHGIPEVGVALMLLANRFVPSETTNWVRGLQALDEVPPLEKGSHKDLFRIRQQHRHSCKK